MRHAIAFALLACLATPALADGVEPSAPLPGATATRIDDQQVQLTFTFEGGACQQVEDPASGGLVGTVQTVVIPTRNTGEICTMQIVPIDVDVTVQAGPDVDTLDVQLLAPNRDIALEGSVPVKPAAD